MKKHILFYSVALVMFFTPLVAETKEPIRIDVLYLNHGPMRPTLRELRNLFPTYGEKIVLFWHDSESEEGYRFKAQKGIKRHTPLVIYIDGQSTLQVNGKPVTFFGFPTGSGPSFFQGKWNIGDLEMALDQATSKN
jgi:hypothetical protein